MYTPNNTTTAKQDKLLLALQTATTAREINLALRRIQATLADCFYVDGRAAVASAKTRESKLAALRAEHCRRMAVRRERTGV